jgi:hypothetical protein
VIFFLGEIYSYRILKKYNNLSAAASEWKKNFIQELENISKKKIIKIQYYKERPWPSGSFISKNIDFSESKNSIFISYLNLPFIKKFIIYRKVIRAINKRLVKKDRNIIITYNFLAEDIKIATFLKRFFSFSWLSICADFNDNQKRSINKKIVNSDKVIFLSEYAYRNYKGKNKLLYLGSIKKIQKNMNKKIKNFLYSGSLGAWTDINNFLNEFSKIKDNNIKLYITTNNKKNIIKRYLDKDKRIIYLGYLNDDKYKYLIKKIDCFVNLRDHNNINNLYNFPSKLLRYFHYNKPVISSYMNNLSSDLKETLIMKTKRQSYLDLINFALKMNLKDISKVKKKMRYFILNKINNDKIFLENISKIVNK